MRPTLGLAQKEAWEYLIKWKGLKFVYSTTSFVTFFLHLGRDKPTWETDVNVEVVF